MSKMMSLGVALAIALVWGMPSASAMNLGVTLHAAPNESDVVLVAQKQKRGKSKRQQLNLSEEHKQKIRETVPREYHQYLPKSITGGTGATPAAAGAR